LLLVRNGTVIAACAVVVMAQTGVSCASATAPAPEPAQAPAPAPTPAPAPLEIRLDQAIEVRIGATLQLAGAPVRLIIEAVTEDSRCPTGVNCVWEGDATLRVRAEAPGAEPAALNLHTHTTRQREADYQGYRVRLVRLMPWPTQGSRIPPEHYVATILVTRST
jgi:hypothetical protein